MQNHSAEIILNYACCIFSIGYIIRYILTHRNKLLFKTIVVYLCAYLNDLIMLCYVVFIV